MLESVQREHEEQLQQQEQEHQQQILHLQQQFHDKITAMQDQYERDFPLKVEAYLADKRRQETQQQEAILTQMNIYGFLEEHHCTDMLEEVREEGLLSYKELLKELNEEESILFIMRVCRVLKKQARELAAMFHALFELDLQPTAMLSYEDYLNNKSSSSPSSYSESIEETKQTVSDDSLSIPEIELDGRFRFTEDSRATILYGYCKSRHTKAVLKVKKAEDSHLLARELTNMHEALDAFHQAKRALEQKGTRLTEDEERDLHTPNAIVRMISHEVVHRSVNGRQYSMVVMEHGGKSLDEYLRKNPQLNRFDKMSLCLQASEVLSCLRMAGRVHLDLKPSNLLVHESDRTILCIDGEAMAKEGEDVSSGLVLSEDYAAPEVLKAVASGRSIRAARSMDMWSFGLVVLYVMKGMSLMRLLDKDSVEALKEELMNNSEDALQDLIERKLANKLRDRDDENLRSFLSECLDVDGGRRLSCVDMRRKAFMTAGLSSCEVNLREMASGVEKMLVNQDRLGQVVESLKNEVKRLMDRDDLCEEDDDTLHDMKKQLKRDPSAEDLEMIKEQLQEIYNHVSS